MFVHTYAFKAQAIIDVIEGKIMTQQHLMEEAPEMEAMLMGTSKVFEVGFMLHTCLVTPLTSKHKQESVLLKEKL